MSSTLFQIGRYDIQHLLGRGAMGMVYLAYDPLLKRSVALKIVTGTSEERGTLLKRFKREAEISAKLNHPNVVTIFDVGEDPRVGPYLAMEYVDGFMLSRLVKDGLGQEQTLRLLIQAASALKSAGDVGIVHRDVKPENMMVHRSGRLKLMDFGIAREDESHFTQSGVIFGTPSYTAPELLSGEPASPVTDRYAFAVTAFELLYQESPFKADSMTATLYSIVNDPPVIPSGMPAEVYHVFLKALAKNPEERYTTLDDFLYALVKNLPMTVEVKERLNSLIEGELIKIKNEITAKFGMTIPRMDSLFMDMLHKNSKLEPTQVLKLGPLPFRKFLMGLALVAFPAAIYAVFLFMKPHEIEIATTPPDSRILLNGKYVGRSPLKIQAEKGANYHVRAEQEGYEPMVRQTTVGEWSLHLILERNPYLVLVQTQPTGAEIFLNGKPAGMTPMSVPVPSKGQHQIILRKSGFEKFEAALAKGQPFPEIVVMKKSR